MEKAASSRRARQIYENQVRNSERLNKETSAMLVASRAEAKDEAQAVFAELRQLRGLEQAIVSEATGLARSSVPAGASKARPAVPAGAPATQKAPNQQVEEEDDDEDEDE